MVSSSFQLIGLGAYDPVEAERLTGVPARRIRRWMQGYWYEHQSVRRYSPPVIASERAGADGPPVIAFADLMEIRFLNAFREFGVSWHAIRIASEQAQSLLNRHHPFSSRVFRTDGKTILAELTPATGDKMLLDLVRNQYAMEKVVSPYLYAGVEFDDLDAPSRWWPLGVDRHVVIDPERAFGAPIVSTAGIPTRVLAQAVEGEGSIEAVAVLYNVDPIAVADAVEYEFGHR